MKIITYISFTDVMNMIMQFDYYKKENAHIRKRHTKKNAKFLLGEQLEKITNEIRRGKSIVELIDSSGSSGFSDPYEETINNSLKAACMHDFNYIRSWANDSAVRDELEIHYETGHKIGESVTFNGLEDCSVIRVIIKRVSNAVIKIWTCYPIASIRRSLQKSRLIRVMGRGIFHTRPPVWRPV